MSKKVRWEDFSPSRRVAIFVMAAVQVGLLVAALLDLRCRSEDEIQGSKRFWTFAVFINWIGPLAYFFLGRKYPAPQEEGILLVSD